MARALTAAVGGHLLVHVAHGVVHAAIPVPTRGWRLAFVVAVLFLAPVAGVVAARRGHRRAGAAVVAAAGLAGLAFEVWFHFVVPNPDHVGHVADVAGAFAATAVLSTAGSALLAVGGGWCWWRGT